MSDELKTARGRELQAAEIDRVAGGDIGLPPGWFPDPLPNPGPQPAWPPADDSSQA